MPDTWIRVHRSIMACRFEIVLAGTDPQHVPAAQNALDEADRLEALMTVFRDTSALAEINRHAHAGPVTVDPELFDLLELSAELHRGTDGAFDITSTPLSRCWGFLHRQGRLPSPDEIERARESVGMHDVVLDHDRRTVHLTRPRAELNLGAIGKGFALDRMAAGLADRNVARALLSAGHSSVLAMGDGAWSWPIDLRSTVHEAALARVHLTAGAMGTSGSGEQYVEVEGVRYGHVIDPRTGWPASGVLSATVVMKSAACADALSTAFLIGGLDLARRYCDGRDDVLAIVTMDDDVRRPRVLGEYRGAKVEAR
jgi:FAD:protein FMN transferase